MTGTHCLVCCLKVTGRISRNETLRFICPNIEKYYVSILVPLETPWLRDTVDFFIFSGDDKTVKLGYFLPGLLKLAEDFPSGRIFHQFPRWVFFTRLDTTGAPRRGLSGTWKGCLEEIDISSDILL